MKTKYLFLIVLFLFAKPAFSQSGNNFIGQIKIFAGNFAPSGWAKCEGQLLPINQNQALFALLGTTYGGNGQTNFALPDLREKLVVNAGQRSGLSNYVIGQTGGANNVTIAVNNLPAHNHSTDFKASSASATTSVPSATVSLAASKNTFNNVTNPILKYTTTAGNVNLPQGTTTNTGGGAAVNISQPVLVCSYIIALTGIFPSRN